MEPKSEIQEVGSSAESIAKRLVSQGIPGQQDFTNKLALTGELVRLELTFRTSNPLSAL